MDETAAILSVVVPAYNEEAVLAAFHRPCRQSWTVSGNVRKYFTSTMAARIGPGP